MKIITLAFSNEDEVYQKFLKQAKEAMSNGKNGGAYFFSITESWGELASDVENSISDWGADE